VTIDRLASRFVWAFSGSVGGSPRKVIVIDQKLECYYGKWEELLLKVSLPGQNILFQIVKCISNRSTCKIC